MLFLAVTVVVAAAAGFVHKWSVSTTTDRPPRPVSRVTLAVLATGGAAAALGDKVGGPAGLGLLVAGLALIVVGSGSAARTRAGFVLIAAGVTANLAVVAADGGMPVRGLPPAVAGADHHHGVSRADHLVALSDSIRIGREELSPGDLSVAAGAAIAAFAAVPRRRSLVRRPALGRS